ncbi:MAG: dienelactone hydrolase [Glaciihabitans sp.]|nr:dienelactone hydrolase [Glaciihabitans sp.]
MADRFAIPSPGAPMWWGEPGAPLVLLVHDFFGRLPWLETVAALLADGGFRVAVPDLYSGIATASPGEAESLMGRLDVRRSLALLDEAVLVGRAEGSERVGVVGFSMGGWLALLHAQGGSADAVVAFYATLGPADHGVVPCPVMLHLADHDEWGPREDPADFIDRLDDHGTPVLDHHYPGTRHSFANGSVPGLLDAPSAQLALTRTAVFLREYLLD